MREASHIWSPLDSVGKLKKVGSFPNDNAPLPVAALSIGGPRGRPNRQRFTRGFSEAVCARVRATRPLPPPASRPTWWPLRQLDGDVTVTELGLELEHKLLHHLGDDLGCEMREGDDGVEPVAELRRKQPVRSSSCADFRAGASVPRRTRQVSITGLGVLKGEMATRWGGKRAKVLRPTFSPKPLLLVVNRPVAHAAARKH
jgi:hypothetical protein